MTTLTPSGPDGDRHLSPPAYCALAILAGVIGLSASYVTVRMFALAIQATEPEGSARELLTLAATLFVVAELAAFFLAGLLPVRRLRALRWQLTACAVALVAFEAVSLYGARVVLLKTAEAQASAHQVRAEQIRTSIEANRRSATALLEAGQHSSQSVIAASRADGARSIRDAAALEAQAQHLAAELAQAEAERRPTASSVFGESGVIALAVAQSLLMSCIGLLFLGAAGALARAARDARDAVTGTGVTPLQDAIPVVVKHTPRGTAATVPKPVATPRAAAVPAAVEHTAPARVCFGAHAVPAGAVLAVPTGLRWAAAGLGSAAMAVPAFAAAVPPAAPAVPMSAPAVPTVAAGAVSGAGVPVVAGALEQAHPETIGVLEQAHPTTTGVLERAHTEAIEHTSEPSAEHTQTARSDTEADEVVDARYERIRAGVLAGSLKPSVRSIQAAEGGGTLVARRYLVELERMGIIEPAGRGRGYRLSCASN